MRVKLSYTIEEEGVLGETAKLIGLVSGDMDQTTKLFKEVQEELRRDQDISPGASNTHKSLQMIEEFRAALLNIDTRLSEVASIIHGLEAHRISPRVADQASLNSAEPEAETIEAPE
jgi:hypothetical protein